MSFSDLLASDVSNVFLNSAEFAESITYFPSGGGQRTITGVRTGDKELDPELQRHHQTLAQTVSMFFRRDAATGLTAPQIGDAIRFDGEPPDVLWSFDVIEDEDPHGMTVRWKRAAVRKAMLGSSRL